jgi:hypothetical protein
MVGSTSALASLVKNQFAYQDKEIFVVVEGAPIVDHPKLDGIVEGQGIATAIATSYKDYGPEMLQYLRGSFALAIVHRQEPRAFLAVDRIGIRSLTYALVKPCSTTCTFMSFLVPCPYIKDFTDCFPEATFPFTEVESRVITIGR